MKLLFAYFDCGSSEAAGGGRGLGEQSLNFSTEYDFTVKKEPLAGNNGIRYLLSRSRKPEDERIPAGFWGDRIYNVSALVGRNGTGKSTLLHSLIKTLVEGLDPELPFLLVLQETDRPEPFVYSNINSVRFQEDSGLERSQFCRDYPEALQRAKIMLIDNTLSVSSMDLMWKGLGTSGWQRQNLFFEGGPFRQFCDKSLCASLQYSNDVSKARQIDDHRPSAFDVLANHFQYESYQDLRTLFDPSHWDMMQELRDHGHPVPYPRYLYVSIKSINQLIEANLRGANLGRIGNLWTNKAGFTGKVCVNLLFGVFYDLLFFINMADENSIPNLPENERPQRSDAFLASLNEMFNQAWKQVNGEDRETMTPYDSRIMLDKVKEQLKNKWPDAYSEERWPDYQKLFLFLETNQNLLEALFQPCSEAENRTVEPDAVALQMPNAAEALYRVDIEQTLRDEALRNCLRVFLQAYRDVSSVIQFLFFSSGLSSGEKNLLRMLTQLRFLLVDPTVYKGKNQNDDDWENGKRLKVLRNSFDETETKRLQRREQTCDTLFLLLDEADLTYHPEWQRRFVDLLCAILPRMFKNPYDPDGNAQGGCKDIQVILATHSPLMLGDFPKASTVYLEAGADIAPSNSFGQNLYTILKDGFFMEDSLGEFAKRKINDAATWCNEVQKLTTREKKLKEEQKRSLDQNCESSQEEQQREELRELKQRKDILKQDLEVHKTTARLLSSGIIRQKLLTELTVCEALLGETRQKKRREREALEQEKQELLAKLKAAEQRLLALEEDDE